MQPKKAPVHVLKHIAKKLSKEDITTHKLNPEDEGQNAIADHDEPEVIVYVPSCKRAFYFELLSVSIAYFFQYVYHSVPASPHFISVIASVWKLYPE